MNRTSSLPFYEGVWIWLQNLCFRWFKIRPNRPILSLLIALTSVFPGLLVGYLLGVHEEFLFISSRLVYWAVILFAFLIMGPINRIWLDNRPFLEKLLIGQDERAVSNILDVVTDPKGQTKYLIATVLLIAIYYPALDPGIESKFVYWYVFVMLLFAGAAASFGLYFSIALVKVSVRLYKQPNLRINIYSPASTSGLVAMNYIATVWSFGYLIELLIILYGCISTPWQTNVWLFRFVLGILVVVLTLWSVTNFLSIQFFIHRILQREKINMLTVLEDIIGQKSPVEMSEVERNFPLVKLMEKVAKSPTLSFEFNQIMKGLFLTIIPAVAVALLKSEDMRGVITDVLKNIGFIF